VLFENLRKTIHKTQRKLDTDEYKSELKESCVSHRRRELPLFPSYTLAQQKIGEFLESWRETMHECLNACAELMVAELSRLLEDVRRFPKLYEILCSKITDIIEKRKLEALETLDDHLNSSKENPYTQNDYYESTVAGLLGEAFMSLVTQIHALILGYWKVCYKEFADFTPKSLLSLLGKVEKDLKLEFRMFDLRNAKELLQEMPEIEDKRGELKQQKKCLEECLKLLKKFNVPLIMRKAAGEMNPSSAISRIRIRENEKSVLKKKIQTLEKENEEQRSQGKKEEKFRAKAINEKLNLKETVENLQMENQHCLEEIQLLTDEKVELLEAKKEGAKLKEKVEKLRGEKEAKKVELFLVNNKSLALQKQIENLERENSDNQLQAKKETSELKTQVKILTKENTENSKIPSALKVSGRVGSLSSMNGIYLRGGEHCGRVYYQKKQTAHKDNWKIQWNGFFCQWEFLFSGLGFIRGKVIDDAEHPLLISKSWEIGSSFSHWKHDSNIKIEQCSLNKAMYLQD
jgi:hypothetical protein